MTNAQLRQLILDKTYIREDCAGWINRLGILAADAGMRMSAISWGSNPQDIANDMADQVSKGACKSNVLLASLGIG
jgi:hypothetical protein